jgi:hypothetical protein
VSGRSNGWRPKVSSPSQVAEVKTSDSHDTADHRRLGTVHDARIGYFQVASELRPTRHPRNSRPRLRACVGSHAIPREGRGSRTLCSPRFFELA